MSVQLFDCWSCCWHQHNWQLSIQTKNAAESFLPITGLQHDMMVLVYGSLHKQRVITMFHVIIIEPQIDLICQMSSAVFANSGWYIRQCEEVEEPAERHHGHRASLKQVLEAPRPKQKTCPLWMIDVALHVQHLTFDHLNLISTGHIMWSTIFFCSPCHSRTGGSKQSGIQENSSYEVAMFPLRSLHRKKKLQIGFFSTKKSQHTAMFKSDFISTTPAEAATCHP